MSCYIVDVSYLLINKLSKYEVKLIKQFDVLKKKIVIPGKYQ